MLLADIAYITSDLKITLQDISLGEPTSWLWSIKKSDATEVATGTTPELEYTFTEDGIFDIYLTVSKSGEVDGIQIIQVSVDFAAGVIYREVSVLGFVQTIIPTAVFEAQAELLAELRAKWQELLYEALSIPPGEIYNETHWPILANYLIAYLIARDLVILESQAILTQTSTQQGGTKKIVTGPTEAEKFPATTTYKELFGDGKPYELINLQICALANRLRVYISGCESQVKFPVKVFYTGDYSYEHRYIRGHPEYDLRKSN